MSKGKRQVTLLHYGGILESNVYLIRNNEDPTKSIIVDAPRESNVPKVLDAIKKEGLKYSDIQMIVVSHCHFDHTAGLCEMKKKLENAKVVVHKSQAENLYKGDFDMPSGSTYKVSDSQKWFVRYPLILLYLCMWLYTSIGGWVGNFLKQK